MTYRRPENCPHDRVVLTRATGKQQCPECGTVLVEHL